MKANHSEVDIREHVVRIYLFLIKHLQVLFLMVQLTKAAVLAAIASLTIY